MVQFFLIVGGILVVIVAGFRIGFRSGTHPANQPNLFRSQKNDGPESDWSFDDEELSTITRFARTAHPIVLRLLIISLVLVGIWWLWPTASHLASKNSTTELNAVEPDTSAYPSPETSTATSTTEVGLRDESTDNWTIYQNDKYGYRLKYPPEWEYLTIPADALDSREDEPILESYQISSPLVDKQQITIRIHLEENSLHYPAANYAATHPARGEERTPFTLHGVRAIKYKSVLLASRQVRWTTFAATADNGPMLVAEMIAPIGIDEFSPLYLRAERIMATIEPEYLIRSTAKDDSSVK